MIQRLLIAALLLALVQGGVHLIRKKREPVVVRAPAVQLAELPQHLGGWRGSAFAIDARLSAAVGAHSILDRVYRDETGAQLQLELATFTSQENELPHMPQTCYVNVGWTMKQQKDIDLRVGNETLRRARILAFEQEGQRIYVMYWYQFGSTNVLDYNGLRRERAKLFGQAAWPPLVKVMIQCPLADLSLAEDQLRSFGEHLLAWTTKL
jgi:EpsI family protein